MALSDADATQAPTQPCTACHRPIVWCVDDKGQRIALDATAPCYEIRGIDRGTGDVSAARTKASGVLHVVVCPRRDQIPKKRLAMVRRRGGR